MSLGGCIFLPVFCCGPSCVTAFGQNACAAIHICGMRQREKYITINSLYFLRHAVNTGA